MFYTSSVLLEDYMMKKKLKLQKIKYWQSIICINRNNIAWKSHTDRTKIILLKGTWIIISSLFVYFCQYLLRYLIVC